mgnify:FL=1
MLYGLIRLLIFSLLFLVIFVLIKKSHFVHKKRLQIISLVVAVTLCTLSGLVPFENTFFSFSSPEKAYSYFNTGKAILTVNGEKSDLVVGKNRESYVYAVLAKADDGWKISLANNIKNVKIKGNGNITVIVERFASSNDYYVTVSDTSNKKNNVTDSDGSDFYCLENNNSDFLIYTYVAHINHFDDGYTVRVGDTEISLS